MNIEHLVADAILETKKEVEIGGVVYEVAPPTLATLIAVSKKVSELPHINKVSTNEIVPETLRFAKDCGCIAEIPAIIILGATGLTERKTITEEKEVIETRFFGLIKTKKVISIEKEIIIDKKKELTDILLKHTSPSLFNQITVTLLSTLEISDFFGFTTSLAEINLIKPTTEVGTTVSGQ